MGFDGAVKKDGENLILNYLKNSGADILCLQEYQTIESSKPMMLYDKTLKLFSGNLLVWKLSGK